MSSDVERIKDRLSMMEVVSPYVKLQKSGRTFKGKSPFTNERTPSFFVDPDKNLFHCFSSGKGGDIFNFIQEVERVDFRTALQMLADKTGITLTHTSDKDYSERTKLYQIMEEATRWYEVMLRTDPVAVEYLINRGMTKDSIKEFHIGYAPAGWTLLTQHLQKKGFSQTLIEKAGLGIPGKEGLYDRFRERIMFPLCDTQGRPIAFTGRIFLKPGSVTDPTTTGKYVNSPETPLYHKSRMIYGFDKARQAITDAGKVIVVEGQMDLIMSHQAGVKNVVALSGTACTDEQLDILQRFTDAIVFALDADPAGISAVTRSVTLAYAHDMDVSVIMLTQKDPADMVKENPESWKTYAQSDINYVEYRLQTLLSQEISDRERLKKIKEDIFPIVVEHASPLAIDTSLQKISLALHTSPDVIRAEFDRYKEKNKKEIVQNNAQEKKKSELPATHFRVSPYHFEELFWTLIVWLESLPETAISVSDYKKKYEEIVGPSWFSALRHRIEKEKSHLIFSAQIRYDEALHDTIIRDLDYCLAMARLKKLEKERHQITERLRSAEQSSDEISALELSAEYQRLSRAIDTCLSEVTSLRNS